MIRNYIGRWQSEWNQFWFTPTTPETLALMRILVGTMVLYTHAVWTLGFDQFLAVDAILPTEYREQLFGHSASWSHFDWLPESLHWPAHFVGLLIVGLFTIGCWTRSMSVLTCLLVISYANRATGALFGLDQIISFLTLYLAIGDCGAAWSIDAWRARSKTSVRNSIGFGQARVSNNVATRLIQVHLSIVYLFAGLGKAQGETWWDGEAIWGALASYEYQTIDLTFLADYMWLVNLLTLVALLWEVSYIALIWPRLTRPLVLGLAIGVHLGIGLAMGMMTFGLVMIYANLAFVEPSCFRSIAERFNQRSAAN